MTTDSLERVAMPSPPLLDVRELRKLFPIRRGLFGREIGQVRAVDGVTFSIGSGETLGLVGESGSGKTTAGRCILRLVEPTSGTVQFDGADILSLGGTEMRRMRKHMQIVFQDPYASLNPRMRVGSIVGEPLVIHGEMNRAGRDERVAELLRRVGLDPTLRTRFPHEFSGGQRQRIGIARALATNPRFLVLDEPVSALDVSVQAQVINLLQDLQSELGLTYLFIAHDLAVVKHVSDRVAVMYFGKIVELAKRDDLYRNPLHPYTRALLSAVPVPDPRTKRKRIILSGEIPSAINPPTGCAFHPRCPIARFPKCSSEVPPLIEHAPGQMAACHFAGEAMPKVVDPRV